MGDLLLYLLLCDLREQNDGELLEYLEAMLAAPNPGSEEAFELLDEVEVMLRNGPDRESIARWPLKYPELLPPSMAEFPEAVEFFEDILKRVPEEKVENPRLSRFERCLALLEAAQGWEARSEAARTLGSLEEELEQYKTQHAGQIPRGVEVSPLSVQAYRAAARSIDLWQEAFLATHLGEFDRAFDKALEASRVIRALQRWNEEIEDVLMAALLVEDLPVDTVEVSS